MKILVAEDERVTRRSLQRQLERWGHEVVAAEDGAEAWAHFQQQPFDIVVTDWDMPNLDGRELVRHIRDSGRSRYAYLIMLTGRSEKTDLVAGMEAGADDFLAKPFDLNELRVRVSAGERIIELERRLSAQNEMLQEANQRMKRDLDAAARLQRGLLPRDLPQTLGGNFAWHYEPCDELGGDTLNVIPLSDRCVGLYLLDVSGHGVPAALLSVTLNRVLTTTDPSSSILMATASDTGGTAAATPRDVATRLNHQFPMGAQQNKYFTLAYAVLDTRTYHLRYVLAGHPPPILARKGESPGKLEGSGFPIGIVDEPDFEEYQISMEPGDRLYFYSDGITEEVDAQGELFGDERLLEAIADGQTLSLNKAVESLVRRVIAWRGEDHLRDDLSILAIAVD